MPKPYDDAMKKLVGGNPQDLVSWVLPGAQFGKQLPFELGVENIYADGLLQATLDGFAFTTEASSWGNLLRESYYKQAL